MENVDSFHELKGAAFTLQLPKALDIDEESKGTPQWEGEQKSYRSEGSPRTAIE